MSISVQVFNDKLNIWSEICCATFSLFHCSDLKILKISFSRFQSVHPVCNYVYKNCLKSPVWLCHYSTEMTQNSGHILFRIPVCTSSISCISSGYIQDTLDVRGISPVDPWGCGWGNPSLLYKGIPASLQLYMGIPPSFLLQLQVPSTGLCID